MKTSSDQEPRYRAEHPDQLLPTQEPAVRTIIKGIAQLTLDRKGAHTVTTERPHQVFLIDGSRGAGKTYTLLSVEYGLKELSALCLPKAQVSNAWRTKLEKWLDDKKIDPKAIVDGSTQLAHTLRVIFPGDLEDGDAVMEAIFAAMTANTEQAIAQAKAASNNEVVDKGKRLNETLRTGVAQGWYFARRFGYDAIVRDSTDYDDLVLRFERESRKAAGRIEAWRIHIEEYLKFHNAATLVVMLDDSDVRPELTSNILHAIRMYLDHPRVVTVLAGNLKAMRVSLLHLRMGALSPAVQALNAEDHPTAREWRRNERKEIEDYLEKVLPPEQRIRVKRPQLVRMAERGRADARSDFKIVVGQSLGAVCEDVMRLHRLWFLDVKFQLAIGRELGRSDAPSQFERATLEYFLAWWIFTNRYREQLQPRSVRQLKTWKVFYDEGVTPFVQFVEMGRLPPGEARHTKRLPVMLFDNPANFTLIHRMGDEDERMPEWLRRQDLEASWVGRRRFRINRSDIEEGTFTYDYLKYRLDLGIAMPIRDNSEEVVSDVMLPALVGRSFMRRFFQPRQMPRRHRRLGLVRWLNHAAIPANCAYFSDLAKLPDVSFVDGLFNERSARDRIEALQSGVWEAELCENWMDLIEDRQEQVEDEYLLRYLREIVFEGLRETKDVSSDALVMALDPPDIFEKRQHAVYEHFMDDEWDMLALDARQRAARYRRASMLLRGASEPVTAQRRATKKEEQDKRRQIREPRMLALYSALTNDLRRAWHAIRIHQASPALIDGTDGGLRQLPDHTSFSAIANRDLMPLLTLAQVKAILNASDWTRALLQVFTRDNVERCLGADAKKPANLDLLFNPKADSTSRMLDPKRSQGAEEAKDFEDWTQSLRHLCRAACYGWPVNDGTPIASIEEDLFGGVTFEGGTAEPFMLKIFRHVQKTVTIEERIRNGRAGRSLVWLLWGLAPSFPAIIHANTMSFVYQAELEWAASKKYSGDDRDELRQSALQFYDKAIELTKDWASLVGTLAIIVRYVKIKCLHLDAAFFLQRMTQDVATDNKAVSSERRQQALADIGRFLKKCNYNLKDRTYDEAGVASLDAINKIGSAFSSPRSDLSLAEGLAIHPDVSPSSLFGDDWMKDLFQRQSIKDHFSHTHINAPDVVAKDNPLSVNGIFGEVEQWLWAASRSLRKVHQRATERRAAHSKEK